VAELLKSRSARADDQRVRRSNGAHAVAIIRPSIDHLDELLEPLGEAERVVVEACAALGDDWTVYVRPRLGQDVPDLVLVHDVRGAITVDVVDWRPTDHRRGDHGDVEVLDADGSWRRGTEQPLAVARRHRSTLYEQFFASPGDARDPGSAVRSVVVLPWCSGSEAGALLTSGLGDPANTVLVWSGDDLTHRLPFLVDGPPSPPASTSSVVRLHRQLVVDGMVARHSVVPVQLSSDARMVASNPRGTPIRGVTGAPGTGKSFALTARAARLAGEGKSVLVLCFNLTLAHRLRSLVAERCAEYGANPVPGDVHELPHVLLAGRRRRRSGRRRRRRTGSRDVAGEDGPQDTCGVRCRLRAPVRRRPRRRGPGLHGRLVEPVARARRAPDGEMLLVADSTVDLYGKSTWDDPTRTSGGGLHRALDPHDEFVPDGAGAGPFDQRVRPVVHRRRRRGARGRRGPGRRRRARVGGGSDRGATSSGSPSWGRPWVERSFGSCASTPGSLLAMSSTSASTTTTASRPRG
jgi:hypothetical protein